MQLCVTIPTAAPSEQLNSELQLRTVSVNEEYNSDDDILRNLLQPLRHPTLTHILIPVMLNNAGEYCEYGDACQVAITVNRSSNAAFKSCMEWLIISYIIGDSAYLIFSAVLQTDRHG